MNFHYCLNLTNLVNSFVVIYVEIDSELNMLDKNLIGQECMVSMDLLGLHYLISTCSTKRIVVFCMFNQLRS